EEPKESESEKKGLLALTPKELKAMLDEEFPGDNIPQWWIDTHCGEKLYEYTWGKYGSKGMNHFYRTAERVINEDTIECDITITLDDDSMRFHKIRLRVDDNGVWSVISDKIVD
ncbi:MAG TPA: S-layer homology domain-containing protein, partial [Clostridiales bacterium]|nr:S-layer homology domain-containing protein [Clostridiales bacterium]